MLEGTTGAGGVLKLVRDGRATTRNELAQQSGLSRSTLAERVQSLLALDLCARLSTRRPMPGCSVAAGCAGAFWLGVSPRAARGSFTVKTLPCPSPSLCASTVPP